MPAAIASPPTAVPFSQVSTGQKFAQQVSASRLGMCAHYQDKYSNPQDVYKGNLASTNFRKALRIGLTAFDV